MYANGTPATGLPVVGKWRKSRRSVTQNCVEVNRLTDGDVAVRNSRDPNGPALVFSPAEWKAFVGGARAGEFDLAD